ncbi:allantoin [Aureobasidium pullulans]|nr:allantoin [Aureobasidium pullulans]
MNQNFLEQPSRMARARALPGRFKTKIVSHKDDFVEATRTKKTFFDWLRTSGSGSDPLGGNGSCDTDLLPTPPEQRNWGYKAYFFLYFSWSIDNWTLGSTMIGIGLNWWQSILVIFGSQCISSIFQAIASRSGAVYHVGFPCVARSVFGMYGAYFAVASRAVMSAVYYALKMYIGSNFVRNMLRATFGSAFHNLGNSIPGSIGISTQGMIAFFLYWVLHIPLTLLRPNQMKWIFTLKMYTIIPAYIGLFVFCMVNTKGRIGGGLASSSKLSSAQFSWFVMNAINAGIGNTATTITNQPDYTRWSNRRWASVIPQLIANPISVATSSTMGILATSAINHNWGLELWNQWDLLDEIMTRYWRPEVRFAVLLCAAAQALLVTGTNVAGNIIPFGADSAMLWPRYLNITRGQLLGLFLVWIIFPWKILASAEVFTTFLGGYGMFMSALVGPTLIEYYVLAKGNIWVTQVYNGHKTNPYYWYHRGWNIQAFIAYVVGIALPITGFAGVLGADVPETAMHIYYIGWLLSLFVSGFVYWVVCKAWPTQAQNAIREKALGWEELQYETTIVLEGHGLEMTASGHGSQGDAVDPSESSFQDKQSAKVAVYRD